MDWSWEILNGKNSLNCQQSKPQEMNVMIAIAMYLQEIELVRSITTILRERYQIWLSAIIFCMTCYYSYKIIR
jgi:hypothetical protein